MNDVKVLSRNQQDEIQELQSEHARRKKKLKMQQEEEVQEIKGDHFKRVQTLKGEGEAAINHIRDSQVESFQKAQENKTKAVAKMSQKMTEIEELYRKKVAEAQQGKAAEIENMRENAKKLVTETAEQTEKKLNEVREDSTKDLEARKQDYRKKMESYQARTQENLSEIDQQNNDIIQRRLNQGEKAAEQVREKNEKELAVIHKTAEQRFKEEKDSQEHKYKRLVTDADRNLDKSKKQWADRERNLNKEYSNKLTQNKEANEESLKKQMSHFVSNYEKNQQAQKTSLGIQSKNFDKQLNEIKKDFVVAATKYQGKEEDPFYRLQNRGSRLIEDSGSFILDAYVPEYEKDKVKVVIQKDRAIVQGQRAFKDSLEEDGKKVSTQTYQSFREDFPFRAPVNTKHLIRERDGDWIRITIPKMFEFERDDEPIKESKTNLKLDKKV